jgi:hypothetical protein
MKPNELGSRHPSGRQDPVDQGPYRIGVGNWSAFNLDVDAVRSAAERWSMALRGVERPWLCWNVDPDWSIVQQRLVSAVDWTPVVGGDPRAPRPPLLKKSIFLDFNADFKFPNMWMHFPLEFAFLFADRLAFWHSDILVREEKLRRIANMFSALRDGSMAAAQPRVPLRQIFNTKGRRYWELIGCTTRGASRSQFENGSGWWMGIAAHPNCKDDRERLRRQRYYWDHGVGIKYWERNYRGEVIVIKESEVAEGHCTRIGNKNYQRLGPDNATRLLTAELRHNFDLVRVCKELNLERFLEDDPGR